MKKRDIARLLYPIRRFKQLLLAEEYLMLKYALDEVSELRALVRYLLPESENYRDYIGQTRASFDYQWRKVYTAEKVVLDEDFTRHAAELVEKHTGLPRSWFPGKKVLDAGCGSGRWSWAFCECEAEVMAIDQSAGAITAVRQVCQNFPHFQAKQHDLLEPLNMPQAFDLVWSFGVLHHTGNTRVALQHIAECVKPGGQLFLMIYGEPRWDHPEDFHTINQYVALRRKLVGMKFDERVAYLEKQNLGKGAWFDALSPKINDLHRLDEIAEWLYLLDFTDLRVTGPYRNFWLMAQRAT